MSDYIRREDAKRAVRRAVQDLPTRVEINYRINLIPAAQIVPVRCEDCVVRKNRFCDIHDIYGAEYCSLGERKDQ